ncbi:ATP-binding protein [Paraburkholderia dipogonis]|uniref:ATP-binding protein n=1 Tax=Paraburkholderia dipogonis TaxID=1211383 RepID=UPI0038B8935C
MSNLDVPEEQAVSKRRQAVTDEGAKFESRPPRFELGRDVILPDSTRVQLEECIAKIDFHRQIYIDWGFGAVDPMGHSTILNFYGPPGTGKTLAAEAFAGTLCMPIVSISIAELESKYMGETGKNLQAAFRTAYEMDAVLFFDEADTLLGKRLSSVTQGIDNEVNAMRSTLLIELERFDGIAIFATNFARNYDEAFRSRITHHVRFDLPDEKARAGIWQRMLVEGIPLEGERQSLVDAASRQSDGLSGRDIRTCMRLALPKALVAARTTGAAPRLQIEHIESAIAEVVSARHEVGSATGRSESTSVLGAKRLLGIES